MSGRVRAALVAGGGPAGTALLIAASRAGLLPGLARLGLTIADSGKALGGGGLHRHAINGDSTARTFLSAVAPSAGPDLAALARHPAALAIASRLGDGDGDAVPLSDVAAFMDMVAEDLAGRVGAAGGSVLLESTALRARRRGDGAWITDVSGPAGVQSLVSRNLVLATGGEERGDRLTRETLGGCRIASLCEGRLVASGDLITHGGVAAVLARLRATKAAHVAVLGSSTSAVACCRLLLATGQASVTLLHRRALRLFYPSAEAALADGYRDFTDADICPVTGFVYRLAGLRMEARALVRQALGVGGRRPDARLRLQRIAGPDDMAAAATLERADLIVHALGYSPRALPVFDEAGRKLRLAADAGGPLVDGRCRVCDATGQVVPGLFALGLAAGFVPSGPLGGEPSFSGQANGLWLWQNDAGRMIAEQLGRRAEQAAAA